MEKIRFAIVGCGNIGVRHAAVVDAEPRAELVALCDIEMEKAQKLSATYGPVPVFSGLAEMLSETEIDVVNICTPHHLHAPMTIQCAEAGRNILVEKPMALSTEECEKMHEAAQNNRVSLFVVKQNRFNLPVRLAKEAI